MTSPGPCESGALFRSGMPPGCPSAPSVLPGLTGSRARSPSRIFGKRQFSGQVAAGPAKIACRRSHLRAWNAMIRMKSPGLDGGDWGVCRDRDLLLGKSGATLLPSGAKVPHKVVNMMNGAANEGSPVFMLRQSQKIFHRIFRGNSPELRRRSNRAARGSCCHSKMHRFSAPGYVTGARRSGRARAAEVRAVPSDRSTNSGGWRWRGLTAVLPRSAEVHGSTGFHSNTRRCPTPSSCTADSW
jgi:hypothetical protein